MLEIIAAQIKEMEDAGWIFRGNSSTACALHVVRKPTEPGKPQKWRITCDYRRTVTEGQNNTNFEHGVWKSRTGSKPRRVKIEEVDE